MRGWIVATALMALPAPALAQPMPAPTPETVVVRIERTQTGQQVEAVVGEAVAVELQTGAGSSWAVSEQPDFLGAPEQVSGPTAQPSASGRPLLGAPRWQVFVFPVNSAGEGILTLVKAGPGAQGVVEEFSVTIVAQ